MQKRFSIQKSRSSYDWQLHEPNILFIEDNDRGMSVTNNIENVLQEIRAELDSHNLDHLQIIYRDTNGMIDGVDTRNNQYAGIFSINETELEKAIAKLKVRKEAANVN